MVLPIAEKLQFPQEVMKKLTGIHKNMDYSSYTDAIQKLFFRDTWEEGLARVQELLGEDPDGMKMLTIMMKACEISYQKYEEAGIDEEIFIATMKCFSRFVKESMARSGSYYFNRAFWTPRQLSLQLFRIGELEYEMTTEDGENYIYLHIPSDAKMNSPALKESCEKARLFIQNYFREYGDAQMRCESWLLSPALKELLSADSNIIKFQENFMIQETFPDANDYMEWVYGIEDEKEIPIAGLPENTSLQRNIKRFLLSGGKVGTAMGILITDPFKE